MVLKFSGRFRCKELHRLASREIIKTKTKFFSSVIVMYILQEMFIDIAANLTDDMFKGTYHGKPRHESDLDSVLQRARESSVDKIIVLAGSVNDAYECLDICNRHDPEGGLLFTTVGFHPTRCDEAALLETEEALSETFGKFVEQSGNRIVALGELGLDYDRLHFCSKETQKKFFDIQLKVAVKKFPHLPLLLHLRNAFDDFIEIIQKYNVKGVVHSFTGTREEMDRLVQLGLYIGINGCSLRESLDVIPHIPEDRLIIETDAPYCDIKPTHASFPYLDGFQLPTTVKPEKFVPGSLVKGRNEPCCINQVAYVISAVRKTDYISISEQIRANTLRLFRNLVK